MSFEAAAAASATPQLRASAAARELGPREPASWCAEILIGARRTLQFAKRRLSSRTRSAR